MQNNYRPYQLEYLNTLDYTPDRKIYEPLRSVHRRLRTELVRQIQALRVNRRKTMGNKRCINHVNNCQVRYLHYGGTSEPSGPEKCFKTPRFAPFKLAQPSRASKHTIKHIQLTKATIRRV